MIDAISEDAGPAPDLQRSRRSKSIPADSTRLPPHAPDAEQGVLGCILISPNDSMGVCIEKFGSAADMFYDLRHQTIFTTLLAMYEKREAIDPITLAQRLKDQQLLEQVGGIAYLSTLPDGVPSAANLSYYLDIVQEKFLLRKMIRVCTEVIGRVYDFEGEVDGLMDEVERDILRISESRVQSHTATMKQLVHSAINTIENYFNRRGALGGIASGFIDLDKKTDGFHGGEMIVIAARPSVGKTSLAMNIAEQVALEQRLPVGVFSLEMTAESLVLRILCSRARVNLRNVRDGFMKEEDFAKLRLAMDKLANAPLLIDDSSALSILQLRAKARRMHQQYGVKLFVIDYLQLLHSTARRAENRQQEIADISGGIKALAKELNVPVIVLSQLNREMERDKNRAPRLSDLRESGAIEQDADLVGLLYKPKSGSEDDDNAVFAEEAEQVNLLIAKQRNGPTGEVELTFLKPYTRFESKAKVSDEDVPN